jgi:RNA polymerase sigma-70 factor (ECF subfamily)
MPEEKVLAKRPPEAAEIDEEALVRECQKGRIESYEPLVKKYQARICAHAYQFVRNETDAEELAQMTFVKAWRKIQSFNGRSSFYTWLYRLCTNTCLDYLRKKKRLGEEIQTSRMNEDDRPGVEDREGQDPGPDTMARNKELKQEIDAAIKQLSPDHQAVIVMREIQGLSYEEIAQTLKCSVGTVMSRLFYARRYLRTKLSSYLS